ncbi:MAG: HNH endonuclease [Peptococcaceae bacterium]|nr:HNH endonuclease [Peptococcaceae bacterium]
MFYNDPINIDSDTWGKILYDKSITNEKVIDILKIIYECDNYEARASIIASQLSIKHHGVINLEISRFSKRVINKIGVTPPCRANGKVRWWHVPFLGYEKGGKFPWIIRPELVTALEKIFGERLSEVRFPEEIPIDEKTTFEGKAKQVYVNIYERNKSARDKCVKHYGYQCIICGFDFEKAYGPIGKNKIHVHHKKPLSEIKDNYEVDPIKDLCPVCPNCHLIIHSKKEPFTIEEMIQIIRC